MSPLFFSRQVMLIDKGNNTVVAEFTGGAIIEIQVKNKIISVMLVTLPIHYRGLTKGLMGNYNLQTEDDLIPKGSSSPIPLDSSKEDIFTFGNTCMIRMI